MAEEQKKNFISSILSTAIFLIVCAIAFYFFKQDKKSKEYDYYAYFNDVKGLTRSSEVQINGVRVGKISDVELTDKRQLKVTVTTKAGVRLPQGTVASLASGGMTGDKVLKLIPGKGPDILSDKAILVTNMDTSVLPMEVRIKPLFNTAKVMLRGSDSMLRVFNLFVRSGLISNTANSLIYLEKETKGYALLSAKYNKESDKIVAGINSAKQSSDKLANNFKDIGSTLQHVKQSTQRMANKDLAREVKSLQTNFASLSKSFGEMNHSQGSLGNLINNKKAYGSTNAALDTLNRNMQDTYNDPPGFTIFGSSKKKK